MSFSSPKSKSSSHDTNLTIIVAVLFLIVTLPAVWKLVGNTFGYGWFTN